MARRGYVYVTFVFCTAFFCFAYFQLIIIENAAFIRKLEFDALNSVQHADHRAGVNASIILNTDHTPELGRKSNRTSRKTKDCSSLRYNIEGASQDDPQLIDFIRRYMLRPPSPHPYNLERPGKTHFSQEDQSEYADKTFFHGMRDGFFVEAGAVDGEYLSNTLYFERELGWRGLLIEPFPDSYLSLLKKNRKAYSINAALAFSTTASEESLLINGGAGELSQIAPALEAKASTNTVSEKATGNSQLMYSIMSYLVPESVVVVKTVKAKSLPLYSILRALNVTVVDFLSLDIESFEVKVLKTLPWDKVKFRLMCIEVNHIPEGLEYLKEFLTGMGYEFLGVKQVDAWFGWPELLNSLKL